MKTLLSTLVLTTTLTSAAFAGPGAPTTSAAAGLTTPESVQTSSAARTAPLVLSESQLDQIVASGFNSGGGPWLDPSIISSQGAKPAMGSEDCD
jgi:hypothetical protein